MSTSDAARSERASYLARAIVPAVTVATLALGLRLGARGEMRAALLFTAPPSAMHHGLAWQIRAIREEEGVREASPQLPLVVRAHAHGHDATWSGTTNSDGVAEAWLDFPDVASGDPVDVTVTSPGEKFPLAEGVVHTDSDEKRVELVSSLLTPSKRDGSIALDVVVADGKLTLGFPSRLWVRALDRASGAPLPGVEIEATPEAGLLIANSAVTTCESGWAEFAATAQGHVTGTMLHARPPRGAKNNGAAQGEWFGGIPVGLGASFIALGPSAVAGPLSFDVVNPTASPVGYLEVDDEKGRAFATTLTYAHAPDGMLHARVDVPPLDPGSYWIVTSSDPRGADHLAASAVARPLRVVDGAAPSLGCAAQVAQSLTAPIGFPRALSLDGSNDAYLRAARRRRRGLLVAVGALLIGALVEVLLVLRERSRARFDAARAEAALEEAGASEAAARMGLYGAPGAVLLGLGVMLLGFALLAAFVLYRGG